MEKLSLLEKLQILLKVSKNSKLFIVLIIFLIFLAYILFSTNKKNKKTTKSIFVLIYTFIFLFIVITYHSSFGKMFDYLMNNLFIIFYFPNLAIYLVAIIITNVIVWKSVFSEKIVKFIKYLNITIFCILNYLLALILSVITSNNLDIYTVSSVYSNKNALGLIELSSTIFVVWVVFLIVYKIYFTYLNKGKKVLMERKLPDNIRETSIPSSVRYVKNKNYNIKNTLEVEKIEKTLTLEDYKLLLNMLKEKEKVDLFTHNDFYNEPEIIETKNIESVKEQSIFEELKALYDINE